MQALVPVTIYKVYNITKLQCLASYQIPQRAKRKDKPQEQITGRQRSWLCIAPIAPWDDYTLGLIWHNPVLLPKRVILSKEPYSLSERTSCLMSCVYPRLCVAMCKVGKKKTGHVSLPRKGKQRSFGWGKPQKIGKGNRKVRQQGKLPLAADVTIEPCQVRLGWVGGSSAQAGAMFPLLLPGA